MRALPWRQRPHHSPRINVSAYHGAKWRAARTRALARQPRCQRCGHGKGLIVHHLDGLGMAGPHALDQRNLVVLCRACHAHEHGPNDHAYRG